MHARESRCRERGGHHIVFPLPTRSLHRNACFSQAIDGGECKIFCLSVVPSQSRENTDVPGKFLIEADAGPVLERPRAPYGLYIRRSPGLLRQAHRFHVAAGSGAIEILQPPDCARMTRERIAPLFLERLAL